MHSAVQRANTVATIAAILLATICAAASFLDAFNSPSLQAHVQVVKINRFRRQLDGNDEVKMTLKMSMDLTSLFTWNTKQVFVFLAAEYETDTNSLNQVSLWDHIVQEKERASFQVKVPTKYPLIDQGTNLRGKKVGLVLHWHIMPISGRMIQGKMPLSNFSLPDSYTTRS
ncbi:Signal peptidase complex subunit 3 [Rhynchospora pubera]|uniref:Signal peptidase complex subunit 3 n=1 Tax=Rhynchospora pubera TaxID=906938 RepID=A0AAV8HPZ4_9POAL|nr:Signal peptidase complex subunit 3 [Rhynchospora pubera]KAJ4818142.1 Signal peptidase complex subunit 3 [Rhynchospora pubera]